MTDDRLDLVRMLNSKTKANRRAVVEDVQGERVQVLGQDPSRDHCSKIFECVAEVLRDCREAEAWHVRSQDMVGV